MLHTAHSRAYAALPDRDEAPRLSAFPASWPRFRVLASVRRARRIRIYHLAGADDAPRCGARRGRGERPQVLAVHHSLVCRSCLADAEGLPAPASRVRQYPQTERKEETHDMAPTLFVPRALQPPKPTITVTTAGIFQLNAPAYEALSGAQRVAVLYDADTQQIVIRPPDEGGPYSAVLTPAKNGKARGGVAATFGERGFAAEFAEFIGRPVSDLTAKPLSAEERDGALVLRLAVPPA